MTTFARKWMGGENPILTKELRTRMRGARAFSILFVYLLVLSLILFFTYLSWWQSQRNDFGNQGTAFTVGKTFYSVLFAVQALLVGLITPALTSGGVSIEKEQRTYELLSVSLLPRRSIVVGKLTAAVSFVLLLLTSSLPLVSIGFLLGGISPGEVTTAFVLLAMTAFLYGAMGIACSAIAKSTATATVMAYGAIIVLFFATLPLTLMGAPGFFGAPGALGQNVALTALNPVGAVTAGTTQETIWGVHFPAWLTALVFNGFLGVIFTLVAIHRLEYPKSDRSGLLRILTAVYIGMSALCLYSVFAPGSLAFGTDIVWPAVVTLLLPFVVVPIFATGDGLPAGRYLAAFLNPRRWFKGEAPSGLVYCLLIVGLCALIFSWGMGWAGTHGQSLVKQTGTNTTITPPRSGGGSKTNTNATGNTTLGSTALQAARDNGPALFTLTAATVFFFGGCGVFFSALTGNRWNALCLTATLMVLMYALPTTITAGRDLLNGEHGSAWDNVLYLSPIPGAIDLAGGTKENPFRKAVVPSTMLFGGTPFYAVTPFVYMVGGLVFLLVAPRADAFRKSRDAHTLEKSATLDTDARDFDQAKRK